METFLKSVSTILSYTIKIGQSNFSILELFLILVSIILVSFIYLRLFRKEKLYIITRDKAPNIAESIPHSLSFEQVQSIKTINIYWNKTMDKDLYHALVSSIELWLVHELHFYDITTLNGLETQ